MQFAAFREVYSKVILSLWIVVAAMLAMQFALNVLKFKSIAAQGIASQMQVVGSTVESSVLRWEQVGLSMQEMDRLHDLIVHEAARSDVIDNILIVGPVGDLVQATDVEAIPEADRQAVMRRVLSGAEPETFIDQNDWVYSGRLLTGSNGAVMGAVIMAAPARLYVPAVQSLTQNLSNTYIAIFLLVSVFMLPVIFHQFRGISSLYRVISEIRAKASVNPAQTHQDVRALVMQLGEGDSLVAQARQEVDLLSGTYLKEPRA